MTMGTAKTKNDKGWLKLPLYLLLAGIIGRFVTRIAVRLILAGWDTWTLEMGDTIFYLQLIVSLVLFLLIGFRLPHIYTKKECFISSSVVAVYAGIVFLAEQLSQHYKMFDLLQLTYYLYIPLDIFTVLTSILAKISGAEMITWLYAVPAMLAPYLFLLFTMDHRGSKSKDGPA